MGQVSQFLGTRGKEVPDTVSTVSFNDAQESIASMYAFYCIWGQNFRNCLFDNAQVIIWKWLRLESFTDAFTAVTVNNKEPHSCQLDSAYLVQETMFGRPKDEANGTSRGCLNIHTSYM